MRWFIDVVLRFWVAFLVVGYGLSSAWAYELGWYYGQSLDPAEWQYIDGLVVQPDHVNARQIRQLHERGIQVLAYISLGEVAGRQMEDLPEKARLSQNQAWNSYRIDTRHALVHKYILDAVDEAVRRGFDGVFLDTVDSYLAAESSVLRMALKQATVRLIRKIRKVIGSERQLWINRGFEMIDSIGDQVDGVAVESLYAGYDAAKDTYVDVSEQARSWLMEWIRKIQGKGLPVIAIEYLPENQIEAARQLAKKISALGIQPWITDGQLTRRGVSRHVPIPRKVLGIYDTDTGHDDLDRSALHRYAAVPIEYLGYQFDYQYVLDELPSDSWTGRYAGVVVWLSNLGMVGLQKLSSLCRWLERKSSDGIRIVMMGSIPSDPACHAVMGVQAVNRPPVKPLKIIADDSGVSQFEARVRVHRRHNYSVTLNDPGQGMAWVTLRDQVGQRFDQVAVTPKGGFALEPYIFNKLPKMLNVKGEQLGSYYYWVFDPFQFFKETLALRPLPVIDVSTENGRRILTAHLDGDGFVSRAELPGTPLASQVIMEQILKKYPIPHTISIIEGEIAPYGAYPKSSQEAERLARSIYRLPFVEAASHTFSHPFVWRYLEGRRDLKQDAYGWNMNIPGYQLSLQREIAGSISYITHKLLPKGKRVEVFLWSGDAVPGDQALALTEKLGLLNMNGGNTRLLPPLLTSLTNVSPVGRPRSTGVQIYAPVMNENVYTNEWTGPYWGYRDVIETFRLLDKPRRLKPISIYYHFYSGAKQASLNALHAVYKWALDQNPTPMYASDYIRRARAVYDAIWFENQRGQLCLRSRYPVRTLRTDRASHLQGHSVLGWSRRGDTDRYVHVLAGQNKTRCFMDGMPQPEEPFLVSSNMVFDVVKIDRDRGRLRLKFNVFKGLQVGEIIFDAENCQVHGLDKSFKVGIYRQPGKRRVSIRISGARYHVKGVGVVCQ